jgi:hypothetical protein
MWFRNLDPAVGLLLGAALCVAVTGLLVFVFLRVARKEKDSSKR